MATTAPEGLIDVTDESPEAVYALAAERGWGDGLPLVLPTPERVDAMLAHATGDPDEVLALLPPRLGELTRRIVAVNAVMAGCPPEVFPVVLTAMRALAVERANLRGVNATTHSVAPLTIVHGEVAKQCGFNAGTGAFGPGNRANATVGRAVRLILLHVAGAHPGTGDASTQGQPSKYTYCIAENIDECPWESYPASIGVDAPSAVTVHCGENPHNVHDMELAGDPSILLDKYASTLASLGMNNAAISQGEIFLMLNPEHAATVARRGWSRSDVSSYVYERARIPAAVFRRHFSTVAWAPWMTAVPDDHPLPMTATPDNIKVVVVGGAGKNAGLVPSFGMTRSVTLPVAG